MADQGEENIPAESDVKYCVACGESIPADSQFCPACGVAQLVASRDNSEDESEGGSPLDSSVQSVTDLTDAAEELTDSDSSQVPPDAWVYGVGAGVFLWALAFFLPTPFAGFAFLGAWVLLPVATYFDLGYQRQYSHLAPWRWVWAVAAAVPIVNIITGSYYLYKIHFRGDER